MCENKAVSEGGVCVSCKLHETKMTSLEFPGGTTIVISQDEFGINYSTDGGGTIYALSFPATITNSNTALGLLKVRFATDILLPENASSYFVIGSSWIQFGSEQLLPGAVRPIISIGVDDYTGLLQNGGSESNGFGNLLVLNLVVNGTGTLSSGSGWFGARAFGKAANNIRILNCVSLGDVPSDCGGILGAQAALQNGLVTLVNCGNLGNFIGASGGGIVGVNAGDGGGVVVCEGCFSLGSIASFAGGIFGEKAGVNGGGFSAQYCYSFGNIAEGGGGIVGQGALNSNLTSGAFNCYSQGSIGTNAGGIFGSNTGSEDADVLVQNCYTTGAVTTEGTGLVGASSFATAVNCYIADGSWSASTANSNLQGTPIPPSKLGNAWLEFEVGQPYGLVNITETAYSLSNIEVEIVDGNPTANMIGSSEIEVVAGEATLPALQGTSFLLLNTDEAQTITINGATGEVSTTEATQPGIYNLTIAFTKGGGEGPYLGYATMNFKLTVSGSGPPPPPPPPPTNTGLSSGAIVGIVAGVIGVLVVWGS